MILYPPCKINIGLHILRKRSDGFHDLELSFFEIDSLTDILEIVPAEVDRFYHYGLPIEGNPENNLVLKAKHKIEEKVGRNLNCFIHLFKKIPMGSGLGGGSADASYTLIGLNQVFRLGFSSGELAEIASGIGSDCAFFCQKSACIGHGKGDILSSLSPIHPDRKTPLLIVVPNLNISTAMAYRGCMVSDDRPSLERLLQQGMESWKDTVHNDFEKTLFPLFPILSEIKDCLYRHGATYASLSGSGSAMFGIFPDGIPSTIFRDIPQGCFIHASAIYL